MKKEISSRNLHQLLASPYFAVLFGSLLLADAASARVVVGMPDASMMPIWGSVAVLGVVAYRLKKRQ
jgi:hypothetical protein